MHVAPREIVDYVYRASRVRGIDSGAASLLGRAACFSVGQLNSDLSNVVAAFAGGRAPNLGFAPVARLEADAARGGGPARLALDDWPEPAVVADLAYPAFSAVRRGTAIALAMADGTTLSPSEWMRAGTAQQPVRELIGDRVAGDPGLEQVVDDRYARAMRDGLYISGPAWSSISDIASGYLVEEAVIDGA